MRKGGYGERVRAHAIRTWYEEALAASKFTARSSLERRLRRAASVFFLAVQFCARALRAICAETELSLDNLGFPASKHGFFSYFAWIPSASRLAKFRATASQESDFCASRVHLVYARVTAFTYHAAPTILSFVLPLPTCGGRTVGNVLGFCSGEPGLNPVRSQMRFLFTLYRDSHFRHRKTTTTTAVFAEWGTQGCRLEMVNKIYTKNMVSEHIRSGA